MPRVVRHPLPLVLACLAVIAVLGVLVRSDDVVTRWDADVVERIALDRTQGTVDLARAITNLGDGLVLAVILIVAGLVLAAARVLRPVAAAAPVASLALGAALAPLLKAIVERPRPPAALHEVVERSSGFPSGHSAQSAAGWLALGLVLVVARRAGARGGQGGTGADGTEAGTDGADRAGADGTGTGADGDGAGLAGDRAPGRAAPRAARRARWPLVVAAVIVLLVGISRVVLSVHSPSDVLAGWLLGLACAVTVVHLLLRVDPGEDRGAPAAIRSSSGAPAADAPRPSGPGGSTRTAS
ncbi:phosphatase PAP2 family protein [Patulibacter sp. NPDC049589]|uniref:phosphatase PAP2 family protein n=1 Tax=Patulibacter sp. NPDC049589 TaxID=3154731 RepID=UPI003435A56D